MSLHKLFRRTWLLSTLTVCFTINSAAQPVITDTTPADATAPDDGNFGAASILPANTEVFFGFYNLADHFSKLKQTRFYKKLNVALGDAFTKSPELDDEAKILTRLTRGNYFIAGTSGTSEVYKFVTNFNKLINSVSYRTALTRPLTQSRAADNILAEALAEPETVELLTNVEVPPLLLGSQVGPDASKLYADILNDKNLKAALNKEKRITRDTFQTAEGEEFTSFSFLIGDFIDSDTVDQLTESLTADLAEILKSSMAKLATKKVEICIGVIKNDWIILAIGKNHDHLVFTDRASSLRETAQFQKLNPLTGKKLAFAFSTSQTTLESLHDSHPFTPILSLTAEAFITQKAFAEPAQLLLDRLPALEAAESELVQVTHSDSVGAGYLDQGLHIQTFGGVNFPGLSEDAPDRFSPLLTTDLMFGYSSSTNKAYTAKLFDFIESLAQTTYDVTNLVLKAPGLDKEISASIGMSMMMGVPLAKEIWSGMRGTADSLGAQGAFLVDTNGTLPESVQKYLGEKTTIPRIATISTIVDRAALTKNWDKLNVTLQQIMAISGKTPPEGVELFTASEVDDATHHGLNIPELDNIGIQAGSVLNDKYIAYGTSQELNAELVAQADSLQATHNGSNLLINVAKFREWVSNFPTNNAELDEAIEWLTALDTINVKIWKDTEWRTELHIDFHDLEIFD